jgi:prophage regulatory protein
MTKHDYARRATAAPNAFFLEINDVIARANVARCTVYEWISLGGFPKPIKSPQGRSLWPAHEVAAWLNANRPAPRQRVKLFNRAA